METIEQQSNDLASSGWLRLQLCETDRLIVEKKHDDVQNLISQFMAEDDEDSLEVISTDELTSSELDTSPSTVRSNWNKENPLMASFCEELCSEVSDNQFVKIQSDEENAKSLRTVMEHELGDLGVPRLGRMICTSCSNYFCTTQLYLFTSRKWKRTRCVYCWNRRPSSAKSIFNVLRDEIAEKWSKMVGKRIESIYGEWDPKLTSLVQKLKDNVLQPNEICDLLKGCTDVRDFIDSCEVIIVTAMIFYMEYVDFRRSCETLINMKPTVSDDQLFEIFSVFFPNRAKGIKTGDFL